LQREIDVIDDAIADEQLLSPSLREQVAKERTAEDKVKSYETAAESMARVRGRLTELSELSREQRNGYANSVTVDLRSSLPQPTSGPIAAVKSAFSTTQYIDCR
jgi:hypothetical protein